MRNRDWEWPVSYHGMGAGKLLAVQNIVREGYKIKYSRREAYGNGIYSSPDINIAQNY